jgi:hypothetical protein
MKSYKAWLFLFVLVIIATISWAEDLTITTYYPSPTGSFNTLRVNQLAVGSGSAYKSASITNFTDGAIIQGNVGIGTTRPQRPLHIAGEQPGTGPAIIVDEYSNQGGAAPDIFFEKARGTMAAPSDAINTDLLGAVHFSGYRGGAFRESVMIRSVVESLGTAIVRSGIGFLTVDDNNIFSEQVRIDHNGNLGIGTETPSHPLTIQGTTGEADDQKILLFDSPGRMLQLGVGGAYGFIATDNYLRFFTGGTILPNQNPVETTNQRIVITNTGLVGIGAPDLPPFTSTSWTGPQWPLDVKGSICIPWNTAGYKIRNQAGTGYIHALSAGVNDNLYIGSGAEAPNQRIIFRTANQERMQIRPDGTWMYGPGLVIVPTAGQRPYLQLNAPNGATYWHISVGGGQAGTNNLSIGHRFPTEAWDPNLFYWDEERVVIIEQDGTIRSRSGHFYGWPDIAEMISASQCEVGDVMVIDDKKNDHIIKSTQPYSPYVCGIISEEPGVLLGADIDKELKEKKPMALAGRVKVKVCDEDGPIHRGDMLVSSSKPGYAMKAEPEKIKPGMVLGKAMEPLEKGEGKIVVLVNVN